MPMYCGIRELFLQALDKAPEDIPLNLGSGVFGFPIFIESANIADTEGTGIVSLAVGTNHFEGTALFDGSVKADDIVVANHLEATGLVPTVDVGNGIVPAPGSGGTVDDDFTNLSHSRNLSFSTQNAQMRMMLMAKDHL